MKHTKHANELISYELGPSDFFISSLKKLKKAKKTEIKHAHIVPLIGGFPMGTAKELGTRPEFIVSYPPFEGHDTHIINYWENKVPYYHIDESDNKTLLTEGLGNDKKELNCRLKDLNHRQINIVTGTPPCAGLSMLNSNAGNSDVRGSDAAVNKWIYLTSEYVCSEIKPDVYLIENAPNAFSQMGRGLADKLREVVEKLGYKLQLLKTTTLLHGLPQGRQRTFYFITKDYIPKLHQVVKKRPHLLEFLKAIPKETIRDGALKEAREYFKKQMIQTWLPNVGLSMSDFIESDAISLHEYINDFNDKLDELLEFAETQATDEDAKKSGQARSPEGSGLRLLRHWVKKRDLEMGLWNSGSRNYLKRGFTASIIAKQFDIIVHPDVDRFLVMDEDKLLMGIPLDFMEISNHNKIAQNVPTFTAASMVGLAKEFVENKLEKTSWDFAKFRNDTGEYVEIIESQKPLF